MKALPVLLMAAANKKFKQRQLRHQLVGSSPCGSRAQTISSAVAEYAKILTSESGVSSK